MELIEQHIAEQGGIILRVSKAILYGEPVSGKTCTRKRLTGEIENLKQGGPFPSTGIEKPHTINLYHNTEKCTFLPTKSSTEWKEQDIKAQCQTILEHILLISQRDPNQSSLPKSQVSEASPPTLYTRPTDVLKEQEKVGGILPKDGALAKLVRNVTATEL